MEKRSFLLSDIEVFYVSIWFYHGIIRTFSITPVSLRIGLKVEGLVLVRESYHVFIFSRRAKLLSEKMVDQNTYINKQQIIELWSDKAIKIPGILE